MYGSFGAGDAAVLGLCKECGYRVKFRFFLCLLMHFLFVEGSIVKT